MVGSTDKHQLWADDGVSGDLGLGHGESRLRGSDSIDQIQEFCILKHFHDINFVTEKLKSLITFQGSQTLESC